MRAAPPTMASPSPDASGFRSAYLRWPVPPQEAHFWNFRPRQELHLVEPNIPVPLQAKHMKDPVPLPLQDGHGPLDTFLPCPLPPQEEHFWNPRPRQVLHLVAPNFPVPLHVKHWNDPVPLPLHAGQGSVLAWEGRQSAAMVNNTRRRPTGG